MRRRNRQGRCSHDVCLRSRHSAVGQLRTVQSIRSNDCSWREPLIPLRAPGASIPLKVVIREPSGDCYRSLWPRLRSGSKRSRTRCFRILASGKPSSRFRSQITSPS